MANRIVVHSHRLPGGSLGQKSHQWDLKSKVLWDHYSETGINGTEPPRWALPLCLASTLFLCSKASVLNGVKLPQPLLSAHCELAAPLCWQTAWLLFSERRSD